MGQVLQSLTGNQISLQNMNVMASECDTLVHKGALLSVTTIREPPFKS